MGVKSPPTSLRREGVWEWGEAPAAFTWEPSGSPSDGQAPVARRGRSYPQAILTQ